MMIPGLDYCPASENETEDSFNLISFSGSFNIPKSQIYGSCRHIDEFKKLVCLKVTSSWVYHKCMDIKKQEIVCVKKPKFTNLSEEAEEIMLLAAKHETQILKNLDHGNIMRFYEPAVGETIESMFLVLESCDFFLSDLMDKKIEALFERSVVKNIFSQVAQALDYIHGKLIMHRDIHPKNFMFKTDGYLKLCNFENAREFNTDNFELNATCKNYHAPELLLKAEKHGPEIDIWAAGCLLAELFLVEMLFTGTTIESILEKMFNLLGMPNNNIWPGYSSLPGLNRLVIQNQHSFNCLPLFFKRNSPQTLQSIELLRDIFVYYPVGRITAKEILEHPYFTESPVASTVADASEILNGPDVKNKMNAVVQTVV